MMKNLFYYFIALYLLNGLSALKAQQTFQFLQFIDNPIYQSDYSLSSNQDIYDSISALAATKFWTDPAPSEWASVPSVMVCDAFANRIVWRFWDTNAQNYGFQAYSHNFSNPSGIAARSSGQVYVADTGNNQIVQLFNNANSVSFISEFGSYGTGPGQFNSPTQITVDPSGDLYVADTGNNRIQKFDANGNPVNSFETSGSDVEPEPTNCIGPFYSTGPFGTPQGIAINYADGSIYVADTTGNIVKFNPSGGVSIAIGPLPQMGPNPIFSSLECDLSGRVYASDIANNLVYVLDQNLNFLSSSNGNPISPFQYLRAVAVDKSFETNGDYFSYNQIWTTEFQRLSEFTYENPIEDLSVPPVLYITPASSSSIPVSITYNLTGPGNVTVQVFSGATTVRTIINNQNQGIGAQGVQFNGKNDAGNFLPAGTYTIAVIETDSSGDITAVDTTIQIQTECYTVVAKWGSTGSGPGQFNINSGNGTDLRVDPSGNIYVLDGWNNFRVQKFDSCGNYITQWPIGSSLTADFMGLSKDGTLLFLNTGKVYNSSGVLQTNLVSAAHLGLDTDFAGNLYSAEIGSADMVNTSTGGVSISYGSGYTYAYDIALDGNNNVFVTDYEGNKVRKFIGNGAGAVTDTVWSSNQSGYPYNKPSFIRTDSNGAVYVVDQEEPLSGESNQIQIFTNEGQLLYKFQIPIANAFLTGFDVDAYGNIFIFDSTHNQVLKISLCTSSAPPCGTPFPTVTNTVTPTITPTPNPSFTHTLTATKTATSTRTPTSTISPTGTLIPSNTPTPVCTAFLGSWSGNENTSGQFNTNEGLAVGGVNDYVYVADAQNNRIQIFDINSNFISQIGGQGVIAGSSDGNLINPFAVALDAKGVIYVADTGNNRIQKFSSEGTYITQWGQQGGNSGQFSFPRGVAVDSGGNIFVADTGNNRIQKLSPLGTPVVAWTSTGNGAQLLNSPFGIALDNSGNVYVADTGNSQAEKFTNSGSPVTQWGASGNTNGLFTSPSGIALDTHGNIYVADSGNNRVQEFNSVQSFISAWGSQGSNNGQFNNPQGIGVDSSGNIFISDTGNSRVVRYGICGATMVPTFSPTPTPTLINTPTPIYCSSTIIPAQIPSVDTYSPFGLALDSSGNIYVADQIDSRVNVYNSAGSYQSSIGTGTLTQPVGVVLDASNNVYVTDISKNVVPEFNPQATPIATWGAAFSINAPYGIAVTTGSGGTTVFFANSGYQNMEELWGTNNLFNWGEEGNVGYGTFESPSGVALDGSGNIYVADSDTGLIQVFNVGSSAVSFVTQWDVTEGTPLLTANFVAVGPNGLVYVSDGFGTVGIFNEMGAILGYVQGTGSAPFGATQGIAVGSSVWIVADSINKQMDEFGTGASCPALSPTPTFTPTVTPTFTKTFTVTQTFTKTYTITNTRTNTATPTVTKTPTRTATATPTKTATNTRTPTRVPGPEVVSQAQEWARITATPTPTPGNSLLSSAVAAPNISQNGEPIRFLVKLTQAGEIKLSIYSLASEEVYRTTVMGNPGTNSLVWELKNQTDQPVASGLYIFVLQVNDGTSVTNKIDKVVVLR